MARTRYSLRPGLEVLEARDTPAGTMTATFAGGGLVVTGDADNNILAVFQGADDRLILLGGAGTLIRLNGASALSQVTLPTPVASGVRINLAGGSDQLSVNGVDLPGRLTIFGGAGDNTVYLTNGVRVKGGLAIAHGAGFDKTYFYGPVTVVGDLTIANGHGGSAVADGPAAGVLNVTGALAITGGPWNDTVELDEIAVGNFGRITVNAGAGINTTKIAPNELTVSGSVSVTSGPHEDKVIFGATRVRIGGNFLVNNGAGGSYTQLSGTGGVTVGGTVSIVAAAGNDEVAAGQFTSPITIGGGLLVSLGDGNSATGVRSTILTVGGPLRINGRSATDYAFIYANEGGVIGGGVAINLGGGAVQKVDIYGGAAPLLTIGGVLRVTTAGIEPGSPGDSIQLRGLSVGLGTTVMTAAGDDAISVNDSVFGGPFTLSTGGGNDFVMVEFAATGGATSFRGAVRVSTGAGHDEVRVGNGTAADRAVLGAASTWDGGPGTIDSLFIEQGGNLLFGPQPTVTGFETIL
jgi:hypothetical protein